jgi:hypothetical protein
MNKKKATEAAQNNTFNRNDTSASNAREIIIQALLTGPKTTIELREQWGVMAPAPRILELKRLGWNIVSIPVSAFTADGIKHHGVARYVLLPEPTAANNGAIGTGDSANDSDASVTPRPK